MRIIRGYRTLLTVAFEGLYCELVARQLRHMLPRHPQTLLMPSPDLLQVGPNLCQPLWRNKGKGLFVRIPVCLEEKAAASPYLSSRGKAARRGTSGRLEHLL
jgi:hypothetical protein